MSGAHHWTFLSNHAHVLICLAAQSDARLRDVAERVGITERAVQRIVAELVADHYVVIKKIGRRNSYVLDGSLHLRHPVEAHCTVDALIALILKGTS